MDKVCNLYSNWKNIQKYLTLILIWSYWLFFSLCFLCLYPSLIILTSYLGFLLLPLHLSAELPQVMGTSLHTSSINNLICLWSICFISAVLTHKFISCLVCLVSSSAMFLVCILSLVDNLSEWNPFLDLPGYALVCQLLTSVYTKNSLLQASSQVSFAMKPCISKWFQAHGALTKEGLKGF